MSSSSLERDKLQPDIHVFKLGDVEVIGVLDSKAIRTGLTPSYGGEVLADTVRELARENGIDPNHYEHAFIPSLVKTGNELVLFDAGNGALQREYEQMRGRVPDGLLTERMQKAGLQVEDVDVVVITHCHPDHIGGLMEGGKARFPNARYVFGAAEFDFWMRGDVRQERKFNRQLFMNLAAPLADRSTFIQPGEQVVSGITAVDAAGHSPGMMAYLIESRGQRLLNWADTCCHFVISLERPDFYFDLDDDKERAAATRKRILEMAVTDKMYVAGYHMPFPGIGSVERRGRGYRWSPLDSQAQ